MKRGQIALFVVIAIIIVGGIGTILYVRQKAAKTEEVSADIRPIKSFVDSCFESTAEDALFMIGKQGGYAYPPIISAGSIAYYLYEGQPLMPERKKIEEQLAFYVNDNLETCIKNFSKFPDFMIISGMPNTTAIILNDRVKFTMNYPLTIQTREKTSQIRSFGTEIPSRILKMYNIAAMIIAEHRQNNRICISCIIEAADKNEMYVNMENSDKNVIIFTIIDSKVLLANQPYEFIFANKY